MHRTTLLGTCFSLYSSKAAGLRSQSVWFKACLLVEAKCPAFAHTICFALLGPGRLLSRSSVIKDRVGGPAADGLHSWLMWQLGWLLSLFGLFSFGVVVINKNSSPIANCMECYLLSHVVITVWTNNIIKTEKDWIFWFRNCLASVTW